MSIYTSKFNSPIGELTIVSNENTILELFLPGHSTHFTKKTLIQGQNEPIIYAKHWLDDYFSGKCPLVDSRKLTPQGTRFQAQVWQILTQIPYGQTVTYGRIARTICQLNHVSKMSAQAVGQAVGKNPIAIMIPCHRVVGASGELTGYAGGIERKLFLLQHEGLYKEKVL